MKREFFTNLFRVITGNLFKLFLGLALGLLLPAVLSLENFGYYRVYALYITYLGIFHLGFVDGIYLKFVGYNYDELERKLFQSLFKIFISIEFIFTLIIIIYSFTMYEGTKEIIFLFLAFNLIPLNLTSYFQFVSQITKRFKEYSHRNIIYSLLVSLLILIFYFYNIDNVFYFLFFVTVINYILMGWYFITYREIVFSRINKSEFDSRAKKVFLQVLKLGFPLLITNFVVIIILNIPKQFVEHYFSIEVFAIFSFAYGILSLVNVFINAIGIVLYPTFSTLSWQKMKENYSFYNSIIIVIVSFALVSFYFLRIIVVKFLPEYTDSISIIFIILPTLLATAVLSVIKINYYKIRKNIKQFLISGVVTLLISIILSLTFYHLYGSSDSIALASLIALFFWSLIIDLYSKKLYDIKFIKNQIFTILIIVLYFNIGAFISSNILLIFTYVFIVILLTLLFYRNELKNIKTLVN